MHGNGFSESCVSACLLKQGRRITIFVAGAGAPVATGSRSECTNAQAPLAFDMSGNLMEWMVDMNDGEGSGQAFTSGFSYVCELCDKGLDCHDCDATRAPLQAPNVRSPKGRSHPSVRTNRCTTLISES